MVSIPGKDPDHLVKIHKISQDRLGRGLPSWRKSIALREVILSIEDSEDPETIVAGCKNIAALLKTVVPASHLDFCSPRYDSRIAEALELLEGFDSTDFEDLDDGLTRMNYLLGDIYDYCDIHRINTGV